MPEIERLERAIAALEAQRGTLGDEVVEAALSPMREKLAAWRTRSPPEQKRKQVTVLFADMSGFTTMSETLDIEQVTEIMNALWARLDGVIAAHGGRVDKHIGDCVMALWGAHLAHEDDAERAVRAALEMQQEVAHRKLPIPPSWQSGISIRIGINSGPVLMGEVGTLGEFTAMGDTVNLASRLEEAAPVGGVLISHATYRHVRGLFDVLPQAPLAVKGKLEPVQTYVVQHAKPRAFRMGTRGVEGIETRMVGRETELETLQSAFASAIAEERTWLVTVIGEAGVGKSRLLYEFENWLELRQEHLYYFKGRSIPAWQHIPYSIFRNMFAYRFDILESDSAAVALSKFRVGMAGILPVERADLVGHWVGFDFGAAASPAVQNLSGSPDFGKLATAYLTHYVQALTQRQPMLVFLEDLHWADDSSLDLVQHLLTAIPKARLLLVGLARPDLFERRPEWGDPATQLKASPSLSHQESAGQAVLERIDLKLLSKPASQSLVDEILQKLETIPVPLRDMIVEGAGGNPFYVEELVKMLIDEGVVERGPDAHKAWRANLERLKQVHVPPALTGILQARLDSLPHEERELLQRAAVVGRLFWGAAVADLTDTGINQVKAALGALCKRELIYRRGHSAFAGTQEYVFKHALLHDVAYETVLLKLRRDYHARVARWLETHAGERVSEYAGLIAEHMEQAGQSQQAASYLRQAAQKALAGGALREALNFFKRAMTLLPEESREQAELLVHMGDVLRQMGNYEGARQQLELSLALAQRLGDEKSCAAALSGLGSIVIRQGDWPLARLYLEKGLALARTINDRAKLAQALEYLGWVEMLQGASPQAMATLSESKALYEALEDHLGLARALNSLGVLANIMSEYAKAQRLYQASLELSREAGARRQEAHALNNLGETSRLQGDYAAARQYYQEALDINQEIGDLHGKGSSRSNLGHVAAAMGDYATAVSCYRESMHIMTSIGAIPINLENMAGLAGVLAHTGQPGQAIELIGLVSSHPALRNDTREQFVDPILAKLRAQLSPEEVEAGLKRGKALQLENVVAEILTAVPSFAL
ncbi:MAG: tetratricopeptide repeat protein [Thermoflexales bacterium]|nr:tetratricopeptide repeat protein [Thermoflexales bacterium]